MSTKPSIEEIVEELSVICEQADRYQTDNGYTVDVPSKVLLRAKLTTLLTSKQNKMLERLEKMYQGVSGEEPFVPYYKPDGMSEEEYASEIHRHEQTRAEWQSSNEYNQAIEDAQTIIKDVMQG